MEYKVAPVDWREVTTAELESNLPGLWPNRMEVISEEDTWKIVLPNGCTVYLKDNDGKIDWVMAGTPDNATSVLWLRSLIYLPTLYDYGAERLVGKVLSQYSYFMKEYVSGPDFSLTNSLDHAVALAIFNLCRLRLRIFERPSDELRGEFSEQDEAELILFLEGLSRDPKVYKPNNHGMFIWVSLLKSRWFWPELNDRRAEYKKDELGILALLESSFSLDGITVENTPSYQAIWVYLVKQVVYLTGAIEESYTLNEHAIWLLDKISTAYSIMVLPTGEVPPLGDGKRSGARGCIPRKGTLTSQATGRFIKNDGRGYFSFTCGAASTVHKQLDDTAVYLNVDGVDLFVDAGVRGYDSFNNEDSMIRGQLGHSGLFFKDFDKVPQSFFYPTSGDRGISARIFYRRSSEIDILKGKIRIGDDYFLERHIEVSDTCCFLIRDCATSRKIGTAVQRFLVPEKAKLEFSAGGGLLCE